MLTTPVILLLVCLWFLIGLFAVKLIRICEMALGKRERSEWSWCFLGVILMAGVLIYVLFSKVPE